MRLSGLREWGRLRRHRRLRKKIVGTPERPRLVVHRSHMHLYAQLVDDMGGKTLLAVSTLQKKFKEQVPKGGNVKAAKRMGQLLAQSAKEAGIKKVVFDRGGYRYFGRVKAIAETAREHGLEL